MTVRGEHSLCGCRAGDFHAPGAEEHYPIDLRLEPVHLDIELRVDVPGRAVAGRVVHRIRANAPGARSLELHAVGFEELAVDDPGGGQVSHTYDGEVLAVTWDEPFAPGEARSLAIAYRVTDPLSGIVFSAPSEAYPDAPLFAVTDHETERARHWLPTIDLPEVRPTLAFALRADAAFTVLANGAPAGEEAHDDGTRTTRYRLDHPCPSYLTCWAVGDFVRRDGDAVGAVPVAAFTTRPFDAADLDRSFGRTSAMLAWMNRRLGVSYPFPKYFQVAVEGIGGAMENISLVTWDDRYVVDEALAAEFAWYVDIVNVHEMAHAWFGDHVVCRDYAHAWLKESWATYMETCWLREVRGEDWGRYQLVTDARAYMREADERYRRPIVTRRFDSTWDMYDMHLYPGGAWRIHMLRELLGDDVFWPAVTTYLERFGGKVVETDDFRRVLEERSGRSLGRFFDQWLRSPGYPKLFVSFRYDGDKKRGLFEVEQRQVDPKAGVPAFDLDLEVAYWLGDVEHRETIELRGKRAQLVVPMAEDPAMVRVDPDMRVLAAVDFFPGEPRLLRQLTQAKDVNGRIEAGWALARKGRRKGIAAIGRAFAEEPFWGVRAQWAEALGRAGAEAAIEVLEALVREQREPESLASVMRAAGNYRDPRLGAALEARVREGLPPRAMEAALLSLGAQRESAPMDLLAAEAGTRGRGGFAQGGALLALGATRRPEAMEALIARLAPGASDSRARPSAARGLGELAGYLERRPRERAVETLVDALRDGDVRVRGAAADGLGSARAHEALSALARHKERVAAQYRPRVDRIVRGVRRGDDSPYRDAERRVEELRKQMGELSDRLQKLEALASAKPSPEGNDAPQEGAPEAKGD